VERKEEDEIVVHTFFELEKWRQATTKTRKNEMKKRMRKMASMR